jgi:hypothetical protein
LPLEVLSVHPEVDIEGAQEDLFSGATEWVAATPPPWWPRRQGIICPSVASRLLKLAARARHGGEMALLAQRGRIVESMEVLVDDRLPLVALDLVSASGLLSWGPQERRD